MMAKYNEIPVDYLKSIINYCPNTGLFEWKRRDDVRECCNSRLQGKPALNANHGGYKAGRINNKLYLAHRVAWAIHYGEWPVDCIDHINMVRYDNRIVNLREATRSQNQWNHKKQSNNTSGYKGVSFSKRRGMWVSVISIHRKRLHLGYFNTKEEAYEAYCMAAVSLHKEFARTK